MAQESRATRSVREKLASRLAEMARELREELYGEAGYPEWGTKFVEIESTVLEVGHELARKIAEQALAEQARHAPPEVFQSDDGEKAVSTGTQERVVETSSGRVIWREPRAYLPKSRKAFSPSGSSTGDQSE